MVAAMTLRMSRRTFLGTVTFASSAAVIGVAPQASASATPAAPRFFLPEPTGPYPVGTVELHLVDPDRIDPFAPSPRVRELMVQVWYPATRVHGFPVAPWMTPLTAAQFAANHALPVELFDAITTNGRVGPPLATLRGGRPVVLFSPGYGGMRTWYTSALEDLASHGYVVVGIDHTYDAEVVEFPDGRVATINQPPDDAGVQLALDVRTRDSRFVIDQLDRLNAGHPVDAGRRRLPDGLCGALDLSRIGMFGHSLGGSTSVRVVSEDHRVGAGANLDGATTLVENPPLPAFPPMVFRPFLQVLADHTPGSSAELLWANLRGWRLQLRFQGCQHGTFVTDFAALVPQVLRVFTLPPELVESLDLGTIGGDRAVTVERAYVGAFFDLHLRGRGHLLDRPSARFPEVVFERR
jgi:predicted dienelactone hydrolase